MDSSSFCKALGPKEANKQLRRHWKTWVTEDILINLSALGVKTLRIPVGDWMFEPYEPYIGCWDGSIEVLDQVIDLCAKHNMTVLIDVHGMKDSQNGLDNSGSTVDLVWFSNVSFEHWNLRGGDWVGHFNRSSQSYDSINRENLLHGLRVVENIVTRYKHNPTVIGIEPGPVPHPPSSPPFFLLLSCSRFLTPPRCLLLSCSSLQ
jgi:glucan 1,3-beta-glucosidase